MIIFIEILIVLTTIAVSYLLININIAKLILHVTTYLITFTISSFAFYFSFLGIAYLTNNFITNLTICVILSLVVATVLRIKINQFSSTKELSDKIMVYFAPKNILRFLTKSLINSCILMLFFIIFDLSIHLLSLSSLREEVKNNSILFTNYLKLMDKDFNKETNPKISTKKKKIASIEEDIEKQEQLFDKIGDLLSNTRSYISEKTGSKELINNLKVIVRISKLNYSEKEALVQSIPEIKALLDHEILTQIYHDQELLGLLVSAGQGSLPSIYKIGDHPLMIKLMDDEKVKLLIKNISLEKIVDQIDLNYINSFKREFIINSVTYQTMGQLTDLDTHLNNISNWPYIASKNGRFKIDAKRKYILINIKLKAKHPLDTLLQLDTDSKFYFFVNATRIDSHDSKKQINKVFTPGNYNITYLIKKGSKPQLDFKLTLRFNPASQ